MPEVFHRKASVSLKIYLHMIQNKPITLYCYIGLKPQLVARLSKALKAEESESVCVENQNESNIDTTEVQLASNSSNELHELASNDSMDIDLADIVVIDEYDSTKNESKHESSSKRVNIVNFLPYLII